MIDHAVAPQIFVDWRPTGYRIWCDLSFEEQQAWRTLDDLVQDLRGGRDVALKKLDEAYRQRDEQFKRAERLLCAQMHPEDRAIDTAAGNDPHSEPYGTVPSQSCGVPRAPQGVGEPMAIIRILDFDVYKDLVPLKNALAERGMSMADLLQVLKRGGQWFPDPDREAVARRDQEWTDALLGPPTDPLSVRPWTPDRAAEARGVAVQQEREQCAGMADKLADFVGRVAPSLQPISAAEAARLIAKAIRGRT